MERRFVRAILLGWIAAVAVDFFLNAGVFAPILKSGDQFILSPQEAFIRIPAGYAALLLPVFIDTLLIYKGPETVTSSGVRSGIVYGLAISSGSVLGL